MVRCSPGRRRFAPTNAIALHVEDVAGARATLEQRGVPFSADTLDTGVCHMAFFADPDGNALMLHHRYAPRARRREARGGTPRRAPRRPALLASEPILAAIV